MHRNHWIALVALGTALGLGLGWAWLRIGAPLFTQSRVATGYMAKSVCSCIFVGGRSLEGCRADALLDHAKTLSRVHVAVANHDKKVTASLFPLAADTARYEDGYGCTLR